MTPAQRKAQLEAAQALIKQVETDELATTETTAPATPTAPVASTIAQAQAQVAASVKPLVAPLAFPNKAVNLPTPAIFTGPGGDTRVSGQPSVLQTMRNVWANMKAKK